MKMVFFYSSRLKQVFNQAPPPAIPYIVQTKIKVKSGCLPRLSLGNGREKALGQIWSLELITEFYHTNAHLQQSHDVRNIISRLKQSHDVQNIISHLNQKP